MTTSPRISLGRSGEALARQYLESRGLTFVGANWRKRGGELDLIMRDGDVLVFIEVKTRHGERGGRAEEALSERQSMRLLGTAEWYLAEHEELEFTAWRVDLIAVTLDANQRVSRITHWPNAIVTG